MVGIAQMARALGCGPRGRGFKSRYSPLRWNQQRITVLAVKRLIAGLALIVVLFGACNINVDQDGNHHAGPYQGYCKTTCNGGPHSWHL